ncbi:hypothetical protein ACJX0J_041004, partial [Zea mays]
SDSVFFIKVFLFSKEYVYRIKELQPIHYTLSKRPLSVECIIIINIVLSITDVFSAGHTGVRNTEILHDIDHPTKVYKKNVYTTNK